MDGMAACKGYLVVVIVKDEDMGKVIVMPMYLV